MKVAAVQLNSQDDPRQNFQKIRALTDEAQKAGAKLILLPENFAFFGPEEVKLKIAKSLSEEVLHFLRELSCQYKIVVVGGGFPHPAKDGKVFNRMVAIGPEGELIFQYDKVHLFDIEVEQINYRESKATEAGKKYPDVFSFMGFLFSGAICYDLRFPEIFRKNQPDVLLLPAAFTKKTGEVHWEVLLRARAIENQCYVVAAAQWGTHFGLRQTFGHSVIVDPNGKILAEIPEGDGFIVAELSVDYLKSLRQSFPVLAHRKFF